MPQIKLVNRAMKTAIANSSKILHTCIACTLFVIGIGRCFDVSLQRQDDQSYVLKHSLLCVTIVSAQKYSIVETRDDQFSRAKLKLQLSQALFLYARQCAHDLGHQDKMSHVIRKPKFWFPTWSDTNRAAQRGRRLLDA